MRTAFHNTLLRPLVQPIGSTVATSWSRPLTTRLLSEMSSEADERGGVRGTQHALPHFPHPRRRPSHKETAPAVYTANFALRWLPLTFCKVEPRICARERPTLC
jgi:hypothetical protein